MTRAELEVYVSNGDPKLRPAAYAALTLRAVLDSGSVLVDRAATQARFDALTKELMR